MSIKSNLARYLIMTPSRPAANDSLKFVAGRQIVLLLACCLCISGCEKPKELDELKTDMADLKQRVARLEQVQQQAQQLAEQQAQQHAKQQAEQQANSINRIEAIQRTIKLCVEATRSLAQNVEGYEKKFYTGFDAYYNLGSGTVQNNVMLNGEKPALYAFNKCMAEKGVPLK
ncbi:MAG: hypothetical protein NT159_09070 [Proteobacteria bacterium]|nr:hypothetical protein [Pseudomonadota bacterium]